MTTHDSFSDEPPAHNHNAHEQNKEEKYEIGDVIAQGGMGIVLEAKDKTLGRIVAMKMVLAKTADVPHENEQLVQEAHTLSCLEHPNIVPIYELSYTKENEPYYTMRKIKGITLTDLIKGLRKQYPETVKNYPLSQLLSIFQKICDAIAYSHSRHILHRDLKPDNIMIGEFGEVLVMDWGLSKSLSSQIDLSTTSYSNQPKNWTLQGWGTKGYIAPEQANKEEIDQRTDIYSLGAILYTLLALRPPAKIKYGKNNFYELIPPSSLNKIFYTKRKKHLFFPHCPNRKIPESLSAVAMKALSHAPEQRYQTVQELQSEITAYQSGFETQAEKAKWSRKLILLVGRYRSQFLIGSAALLIIIGLSANFLIRLIASEKEATQALNDLRATAPIFYSEAITLLKKNQVNEALKQIQTAIQLNPKDAEYHNFEGNLFQIALDFQQAIASYERALTIEPKLALAEKNKQLCQNWQKQVSNNPSYIDSEAVGNLAREILNQERPYDALALITSYIINNSSTNPNWTRKDPVLNKTWKELIIENLSISSTGRLQLKLAQISFVDLNFISWIPLNHLAIWFVSVQDLTPLANMPLEELDINAYQSADLTPIKTLPLKKLTLGINGHRDLSLLRHLAIEELTLTANTVSNIEPLQDLPLKYLKLIKLKISDIDAVKKMPLIKFTCSGTKFSDLSPLKGKKLSLLIASACPIQDLSPLEGMPLIELNLRKTPVTNINSLANMPLIRLDLGQCKNLQDISILQTCTNLEELILPPNAKNIEFLKKMPRLRGLSYEFIGSVHRWRPKYNTQTFWENYAREKIIAPVNLNISQPKLPKPQPPKNHFKNKKTRTSIKQ